MDWSKQTTDDDGSIILLSPTAPLTIKAWSAPSVVPHRRDFRAAMLDENANVVPTGIVWTESDVVDLGNGYYRATFDNPAQGYLAFFIKATYTGPEGRVFTFTTEANIIPNNFPYEDCEGLACSGGLV